MRHSRCCRRIEQMAFRETTGGGGPGARRLDRAAAEGPRTARVEATACRDVARVRYGFTKADIRRVAQQTFVETNRTVGMIETTSKGGM